ncbi:MAG: AMP-binding protein, partial [Steroidobacteraceae bacterium]
MHDSARDESARPVDAVASSSATGLPPAAVLERFAAHDGTIPSFLAARTSVQPDRRVLRVEQREGGGREWTYHELEEASELLARALAHGAIGRGDRIALVAHNSDLSLILFLAAARLGAIFVPLNPAASRADLDYLLAHSRAALIVAQPTEFERVAEAAHALVRAGDPTRAPALASLAEWGIAAVSAMDVIERLRALAAAEGREAGRGDAPGVQPDDAAVV